MILDFAVVTIVNGGVLLARIGAVRSDDARLADGGLALAAVRELSAEVARKEDRINRESPGGYAGLEIDGRISGNRQRYGTTAGTACEGNDARFAAIADAIAAAIAGKEDVANKSTDGTMAANSDTLYPSQKAAKTYADNKLALAGGTMTGQLNVGSGLGLAGSNGMDVFNTTSTGYQRFGFDGGNGPMFQLFGKDHAQAGKCYFDSYGGFIFRFDTGFAASVVFPGSSNVPNLAGFDTGGAPSNTGTPSNWVRVELDGNDGYIPWHAA